MSRLLPPPPPCCDWKLMRASGTAASRGARSFSNSVEVSSRSLRNFRYTVAVPTSIRDKADSTSERSEEHTSELQSLMRISYAVFCLKKKKKTQRKHIDNWTKQIQTTSEREIN